MITFKEWLKIQESSAFTRRRAETAKGLKPPMADFMSRSTPTEPEFFKKKKSPKKKRK